MTNVFSFTGANMRALMYHYSVLQTRHELPRVVQQLLAITALLHKLLTLLVHEGF